jgi:Glycosyltransferases involved in cell wall biogenesis
MLSAVVITKNEEKYIEKCLKSISFCDEIVVVDNFSTDKTVEIAKKYTKNIFERSLNDNFSEQKNFGISKSKGDWILSIDGDEEVDRDLRQEIVKVRETEKNEEYDGYLIKRQDILFGKMMKHGDSSGWFMRLAKKSSARWVRSVHETLEVNGNVGKLKGKLIHHSHDRVSQFFGGHKLLLNIAL